MSSVHDILNDMKAQIILGNQLFPYKFYKDTPHKIFMCEDWELCTHFKYHKHKIIFFLSSMRHFAQELAEKGKDVSYFQLKKEPHFFNCLKRFIRKNKIKEIQLYEVEDKFFEKQIQDFAKENKLELVVKKTPMFMVSRREFKAYLEKVKRPFMKTFYEQKRKDFNILMDENGPIGGKFSYDSENRKKIPLKFDVIKNKFPSVRDEITEEVKKIVEYFFSSHPGDVNNYWIPVKRQEALSWFNLFLKNKFESFGDFQDSIDTRDPFLYHSLLSAFINIGFLTPDEVVKKAEQAAVSLNSKEGFIRQVMGWREFVRGIYQFYSDRQDKSNFFSHQRKLTSDWYEATTGILPLDDAIKKANQFSYCHHIERLMILSNMMLLCEINPQEVHRWFMEFFTDSSDWVMGPNVYGMGQFSDGGIFATKPYISGSNYILKMSHYKKGEWSDIWDGLYWRFIERKKDFFQKQPRMNMMVKSLEKMDPERKRKIFSAAEKFLKEKTLL